jgi:hypothetical protein
MSHEMRRAIADLSADAYRAASTETDLVVCQALIDCAYSGWASTGLSLLQIADRADEALEGR